jgi:tetratricopeptide (TPR) repeat protein
MRLPRVAVSQCMIGIGVLATLFGIYMYIVRESMRPGIGFVGNNGVHWSRRMSDKEIAETDWSLIATVFHTRGLDRARNRKYDDAIDDFTEAIRLNPKAANYFIDRGDAWAATGDREKASADYRKAELLKRTP